MHNSRKPKLDVRSTLQSCSHFASSVIRASNETSSFHKSRQTRAKLTTALLALASLQIAVERASCQLPNVPPASQPNPPPPDSPIVLTFDIDKCLNCICLASSLCSDAQLKCDSSGECGAYKLSFTYWADAGALSPHSNSSRFDDEDDFLSSSSISLLAQPRDFELCATNKDCARRSVKNYFLKHAMDCNNDAKIDCLDMAAVHRAGSAECSADWLKETDFWQNFQLSGCVPNLPQRIFAPRQQQPAATRADSRPPPRLTPGAGRGRSFRADRSTGEFNNTFSSQVQLALTGACLECLCESHAGCQFVSAACSETSNVACGPFGITRDYWLDASSPGGSWFACTRSRDCSQTTIRNYMTRYATDCDSDGQLTCADIGLIHARGADECRAAVNDPVARRLSPFYDRFDACLARKQVQRLPSNGLGNDLQLLPTLAPPSPTQAQRQPRPPPNPTDSENSFDVPRIPTPPPEQPGRLSSLQPQPSFPPVQPDESIPQPPPTGGASFFKPTQGPPLAANSDDGFEAPRQPNSDANSNFNPNSNSNLNPNPNPNLRPPVNPNTANSDSESSEVPSRPSSANVFGEELANAQRSPRESSPSNAPSLGEEAARNSSSATPISAECFECICEAATNCNQASRCQSSDVRHTRCGMFLISFDEWTTTKLSTQLVSSADLLSDPAASERAFYSCVTSRSCGEQVLAELASTGQEARVDCNGDKRFDCYDLAAMHQAGKASCNSAQFLESQYWNDFNACFGF